MRRIPTPRDERRAETFDLDAHRRRSSAFDEPASFAPASPAAMRPIEALAFERRDLAAMQLLEAAEAAMRLAHASDDRSLWTARPFTIAGLVEATLEACEPRARALGITLRRESAAHDAPQVIGEPHRLSQALAKLVSLALEGRGLTGAVISHRTRRLDHRLVADITLTLERRGLPAGAPETGSADEIEIDSQLSLILPPDVLGAAIGLTGLQPPAPLSATMRLRLPLARTQSGFAKARTRSAFDETALEGLKLLVVEDVDLNRDLLQMLLSPFGCSLVEAVNGREALEALDASDFDIILMDLQLPQMDGFEAMRRIRARGDDRARTPILAVSGRAMAADVAMSRAAGADGHLSKPYTTQDLVTAIVECREAAGRE